MVSKSVMGAALVAAVASMVAVPGKGHRNVHSTGGALVKGNGCSGPNGCGAHPKDPNTKKAPQVVG